MTSMAAMKVGLILRAEYTMSMADTKVGLIPAVESMMNMDGTRERLKSRNPDQSRIDRFCKDIYYQVWVAFYSFLNKNHYQYNVV